MLQRFPMSSVQLLRMEPNFWSGPGRGSDPNFCPEPGRGCLWSEPESRIRGMVCNCTIGKLPWGNTWNFSLFSFPIPFWWLFLPPFFLPSFQDLQDLQDGCLTRRSQHPTSLCQPLVGTAMPAAQNFWFRQDRIFSLLRSGFFVTSLGVACKDDIPPNRWEFLLRNCKQSNRVWASPKNFESFIYQEQTKRYPIQLFVLAKGLLNNGRGPVLGDWCEKIRKPNDLTFIGNNWKTFQNLLETVCSTYFPKLLIGQDLMVETNPSNIIWY